MLYAAIASPETTVVPGTSRAPRSAQGAAGSTSGSTASALKWIFGILFMLVGGLFVVVGFVQFVETMRIAQREPKVLTGAELCRLKSTEAAPGWIAYTFSETKPIDVSVPRRRLGNAGEVQARCLLVRVEDKWLVATVAQGFDDDRLVGRLVSRDSAATQTLLERAAKLVPAGATLLPYEFNAVDGSTSDQQERYTAVGVLTVLGMLGLFLGIWLFRRRQPAAAVSSPAATTNWTYHPLPAAK
jgi:hypothetical protein